MSSTPVCGTSAGAADRPLRWGTECVRGLPEVFDTAARPWVRTDGAATDR
ncbi:(4Fe-4S)-binding protein [Streptomyces flaveus]